ncbi:putative cysteine desulfurase [Thalassoglobus neptunius]|uniref:cysteine desulfurase n=1 Tax=Thalassoglobus neptunius TaxID=1938619 RepID=A0A5C5X7K5_9PLAN|nr:aminotransferase class V-fold PLP-dependent enzyme [Thalassoglobus neptunius]TWT58649.1 putative cysteine desulfurase [Thalassoglobus neptunius]
MMEPKKRLYLDNAATSFPKPEPVHLASDRYSRSVGCAVGRSATGKGQEVQRTVDRCRLRVSNLLDIGSPDRVVFTLNGTDSLNLALHGLVKPGDHVVTTHWEHNSVLRPLNFLEKQIGISVQFVNSDEAGRVDLSHLKTLLQQRPRILCLTHASNVTGVLQPVEQIAELTRESQTLILLDAAQSVGHLPVSLSKLGVDILACPGHKGLLGPLGTGVLAFREGMEELIDSVRQGGTGTTSNEAEQPDSLPEKYEPGNHNAPGLFGLDAAIEWIEDKGIDWIRNHEQNLTEQLCAGLRGIPQIEPALETETQNRVGVVSCNLKSLDPQTFCSLLDEHFGIETRAGLHCAPKAHQALGTLERGGTVRFSFSPFNTTEEIDYTLESIAQVASAV